MPRPRISLANGILIPVPFFKRGRAFFWVSLTILKKDSNMEVVYDYEQNKPLDMFLGLRFAVQVTLQLCRFFIVLHM